MGSSLRHPVLVRLLAAASEAQHLAGDHRRPEIASGTHACGWTARV